MDAKIFRINYKSDFVLTINSDAGWAVPFCIKFWTGMPSHGYFAGFDGENYVNCRVGETPTQLLVMFDDHHMQIGPLRMQIAYHTTIKEFPDRKFDEVTNPTNVTVDIDGTEYQVMLDFTGETGAEIDFSMPSSGVMSVNGKIGYVTLNAEDVGAQPTIEDLATIRSGAAEGATAVQPAEMTAALATKQDTIPDLATIRSGAAAGSTAVQPAALQEALAGKQDTIADLSTIRSGAAAGATAVQPAGLQEGLATKQDTIADLSTIRSGAAAGATAVQPAAITPIQTALQTIEAVIPSAASSQNQLADKNFVNSSIATNTANFVGTYNSLAELQAVQNPTNNDYGFVIETDAQGNEYYDRYKYVAASQQWLFEYKVESTPFTAAQWAAIQSGITSTLVTKLNALPTAQQLSNQLAAKQDTISDLATIRSGAAAGSTAVQPAAMNTALAAKQDTISDLATIRSNAANAETNTGNKAYNVADFSGLGRVNLQKNIVEVIGTNKNVLTQSMVNTANTIYVIQYDYDLNGQSIILPVNSVLEFNGGSFSNGTIVANYQMFVNVFDSQIFKNITITGYVKNELLPVVWFGVKADNSEYIDDNSRIIEALLDMNVPLVFPKGNVYIRNINLDLSTALSFKLLGADAINDRVSDPSRNTTNFMNDGESFFICFSTKTTKRNVTIKNITFKCTENGYIGNFINTTSNTSYTNSDISLYVYNCLFSDMDYVVKHNAYGTYLTFDNCIFRRIRTAVSFDKNCNLAKLTNLSFFGVGQCLKVYGSKCTMSRIEFDCIYRGEDWESLDLFGIYTQLVCYISHVYEEIYASHNSMYKYKLIEYSNSRSVYLYIDDMSFPLVENTGKTERLSHIHINNVTLGLPCNLATIDCRGGSDQIPYVFTSDLNMNGAEVLPYNITYNGNTIYSKTICSGARTMPIKVQNVALAKSTITANKYAFNFTFSKDDNLYGSPLTDAQKLNGAYYRDSVFNSAYSPVVDIVGVLNIDSIKDASDNELTGKFKFYIAPNNWKQNGLQAEDLVGEFSYNSSPLRIQFNERRQVLGHIYYGGYYFVIQYVNGDTNYIQFTNTSKVNGTISFEVKPVQNTLVTY